MLQITVTLSEGYDEEKQEFVDTEECVLSLEHSLVSASKWEAEFERPFLGFDKKTSEQTLAYIGMMILPGDYPEKVLDHLSAENIKEIDGYINSKQTATWFSEPREDDKKPRETITTEIIYYWMIALNVPFECQYWHLNRLLTLIKVCNIKNTPKEKMSRSQQAAQWRTLNAQRRAATGSSG